METLMKKTELFVLVIMAAMCSHAQTLRVVDCDGSTPLSGLLGEDMLSIDSLVVRGSLRHADFPVLKECCRDGRLSGIDLSGCTVEDDSIPDMAFSGTIPGIHCIWGLRHVTLPEGLRAIGRFAFAGTGLEELRLPQSVRVMGEAAFYNCKYLGGTVVLPEGMTRVESDLFRNCFGLRHVVFPSTLTHICATAFDNATEVEEVDLPEGLEYIGKDAFCSNKQIACVTIPDGVKELGAFQHCEQLREVHLPDGLRRIGDSCFDGCPLEEVNWPQGLQEIGSDAFYHVRLLDIIFPDGLATIRSYAFDGCNQLKRVVLPEGITLLEGDAFRNCKSLRQVYMRSPVPPVRADLVNGSFMLSGTTVPFTGLPDDAVLYVPVGSKVLYEQCEEWSVFSDIVEVETFPSSVGHITMPGDGAFSVYRPDGALSAKGRAGGVGLQRGVNIVRKDGVTRKVISR